jgi:hypothetical protein
MKDRQSNDPSRAIKSPVKKMPDQVERRHSDRRIGCIPRLRLAIAIPPLLADIVEKGES